MTDPGPDRRHSLPQLGEDVLLADGGIETTLVFHEGLDLPHFAAFHLLSSEEGKAALRRYFRTHARLARDAGLGIVLETPTWRASADWGARLGYGAEALADANRRAVELVCGVRDETPEVRVVVSGCVGPRGDGYAVDETLSVEEARRYHGLQIRSFADSEADMIGAITMTHAEEAAGVALAARHAGLPVAISFTVETDGRLPSGQSLGEAVEQVDAASDGYPAYYMINCAHPTHFDRALEEDEPWTRRLGGIRANASRRSHAELDAADDLDTGDPEELAALYAGLRRRMPWLRVLGGCCGTDHRHIGAIARACHPGRNAA